jgi:hypothetical protein
VAEELGFFSPFDKLRDPAKKIENTGVGKGKFN